MISEQSATVAGRLSGRLSTAPLVTTRSLILGRAPTLTTSSCKSGCVAGVRLLIGYRAAKVPVKSMEIQNSGCTAWDTATRQPDNYFTCDGCPIYPLVFPIKVKLTSYVSQGYLAHVLSVTGEVLEDTVDSIQGNNVVVQGGRGVQFSGATEAPTPPPATPTTPPSATPPPATPTTPPPATPPTIPPPAGTWAIDSVALANGDTSVPATGTFAVTVNFSALEAAKVHIYCLLRLILQVTVDILDSNGWGWLGGGSNAVSTGTGTSTVSVAIQTSLPSVSTLQLKGKVSYLNAL